MKSGKTSKYLKYAVGEILLVMIGILLALQVNNWNEDRKLRGNEIKLTKQLLEDAKADSVFFNSRLHIKRSFGTLFNNLIAMNNGKNADSIGKLKLFTIPFFNRLAYQSNLITNNPDAYDKITNDSIKVKLREYMAAYEYVSVGIELSNRINEEYGMPLLIKYYAEINDLGEDPVIGDLHFALEDPKTVAIFELFETYTLNYGVQLESFLVINQELIKHLKSYIDYSE